MIESYGLHPTQSIRAQVTNAVLRATGAVVVIVSLSLVLVNVFFRYGELILPAPEVRFWGLAFSLTSSLSASAILALLVSHISLNAAKRGFRFAMLFLVLMYQSLIPTWSVKWYELVDDWGLTRVALASCSFFIATASATLFWLHRRQIGSYAPPVRP